MAKHVQAKYESVLLVLVGMAAGFVMLLGFSRLFQWQISHTLSLQIDPLNMASLIVIVLLAIFIVKQLRTGGGVSKSKLEMFTKYLNELRDEVGGIIAAIAFKRVLPIEEVEAKAQLMQMHLASIIRLAVSQGLVDDHSPAGIGTIAVLKEIGLLLTDTAKREGEPDGALRMEKEMLHYEQSRLSRIAATVYDFNSRVFDLVVEVRKAVENE